MNSRLQRLRTFPRMAAFFDGSVGKMDPHRKALCGAADSYPSPTQDRGQIGLGQPARARHIPPSAQSLRYCTNVAIHIEPRNPANRSSVQPRSSTKRCHSAPSNVAASTSRHSSSLMASLPVAAAARA